MVQSDIYQSRVATPMPSGPAQIDVRGAGAGGARLMALGSALGQLAETAGQIADQDAKEWATTQLSQARLDWTRNLMERKTSAPAGAAGFADGFQTDFTKWSDGALKAAPNERARMFLAGRLGDLRAGLTEQAASFELGERTRSRVQSLSDQIETGTATVQADPSQFRAVFEEQDRAIGALDIPAADKDALWAKARRDLSWAASVAHVIGDPNAVRTELAPAVMGGRAAYLAALYGRESGGQVDAANPHSSARGRGQLLESTWNGLSKQRPDLGLTPQGRIGTDPDSLAQQDRAIVALTDGNAAALRKAGVEPNDANLYAAHFLGASGATAFLNAAPDQLVDQDGVVSADALKANRKVFYRADGSARTVGEITQGFARQFPGRNWASNGAAGDHRGFPEDSPFRQLNADQRMRLYDMADAQARRQDAETRQAQTAENADYLRSADDRIAFLMAGNMPVDQRYSRPELIARLGEDKGGRLADDMEDAAAFGRTYAQVTTMPEAELAAALKSQQAETLANPDQYKREAGQLSLLERAAAARQQALTKDPAAAVVQWSAPVKAAAQALAEGGADPAGNDRLPQLAGAYAAATLAEQARLGVPAAQRRILTDAQVESIGGSFKADQKTGGTNAAAAIGTLAGQWGRDWPQVFGELSAAGKLPDAALVIGAGMAPDAAALLAETAALKPDQLAQGLDPANVKTLKSYVSTAIAPLAETFAYQRGGLSTASVIAAQAERLALAYMRRGDDAGTAAQQAAKAVGLDRYSLYDTYRVPATIDGPLVERGARAALAALTPDQVQAISRTPGLRPEDASAQYLSAVRAGAHWATNGDETGLTLKYGGADVLRPDGQPVALPWPDLITLGRTVPEYRPGRYLRLVP